MFRLLLIALACAFVSACAPMNLYGVPPAPTPMEPTTSLDEPAISAAMRPGHAIVHGQAFSKTVGGDVKYGAGAQILVLPNTDYVSQCIDILKIKYITTNCGASLFKLGRVVIADGEGRFEISDLAPGDYSISTLITWGIPTGYGIEQTGGVVSTVVSVKSDADVITANVN